MKAFSRLLDSLLFTPSRNGKLRLLADYFARQPDPDRGIALAALTGGLDFPGAKPKTIREVAMARVDPHLFGLSYDYVGDLAETVALIWPARAGVNEAPPSVREVVETLASGRRGAVPALLENWLDRLDETGRWALLKLVTGGLRVGVSARLAKTALAQWGNTDVADIEELWHGLEPPYEPLFAWLAGEGPKPDIDEAAVFRLLMLATPLEDDELHGLDIAAYRAEWKWDGIRVQLAARGGHRRLFSRTGDDVSGAFPDVVEAMDFDAVLDGELLVSASGPDAPFEVAPFNDLQQRLNRKTVTRAMLQERPAFVRLYDILFDGAEDLRALPFDDRRARLESWIARVVPARMDLSETVAVAGRDALLSLRDSSRARGIEGLMLKRGDSPYVAGRPKGPWYKLKRGALTADCVLMYAQRGHGKRSSYYSDYTFGAWRDDALVPVGKAYFGFTDEELMQLDRWVRRNTVNRFGPVREVAPELVLEVAFDSVHESTRHKSGLAMRFPRVHRIRWDKPVAEADRVETLEKLIER